MPRKNIKPVNPAEIAFLHKQLGEEAIGRVEARREALLSESKAPPPIENLVFEGGGAKGIVYIGALEVLEEQQMNQAVQRVAGSSAGGIISGLVAVGYSAAEIKEIMAKELNLLDLMDHRVEWDPKLKSFPVGLSNIVSLFKHKGLFKGDAFKVIMRKMLKRKLEEKLINHIQQSDPNPLTTAQQASRLQTLLNRYHISDLGRVTFGQLHTMNEEMPDLNIKDLYITTTRLTDATLKVFSHETDPNAEVVDAVRMTMSFPFAFEPVYYRGHYFADGGIANNAPQGIFDKGKYLSHGLNEAGVNPCTLGFLVDSKDEIDARWGIKKSEKRLKDGSIKNYVASLIASAHSRLDELHDKYSVSTVQIFDTGIDTLNFALTDAEIERGIQEGRKETQQYIDTYRDPRNIYQAQPEYQDLYQQYFSMNSKALTEVHTDLLDALAEISGIIEVLESPSYQEAIAKAQEALEDVPKDKLEEQSALLEQQKSLENEVWQIQSDIENLQVLMDEKLEQRERLKTQWQATMEQHILHPKDQILNEKLDEISDETQALAIELEKILQSQDALERDKKQALEKIEKLQKTMDPELQEPLRMLDQHRANQTEEMLSQLYTQQDSLNEHIDIILDAYDAKGIDKKDVRIMHEQALLLESPESEHEEADVQQSPPFETDEEEVQEAYVESVQELTQRLFGSSKDSVAFETREDIAHNLTEMTTVDGETYGKHISHFDVIQVQENPVDQMRTLKSMQIKPPIQADILIPEKQSAQNKNQKVKPIYMIFHEPDQSTKLGRKKQSYSLASKYCRDRGQDWEAHKQRFLKEIRWSVKKIQDAPMIPKDAKIHLTLGGEGFAGLDAQLMLNAVVEALHASSDEDVLNHIDQIDLMLTDSPKVSYKVANAFANRFNELERRQKVPSVQFYHQKNLERFGCWVPHNYFGQTDISTHAISKHINTNVQVRNSDGTVRERVRSTDDREKTIRTLNSRHWLSKNPIFRQYHKLTLNVSALTKWFVRDFIPTLLRVSIKIVSRASRFANRLNPVGMLYHAKKLFNKTFESRTRFVEDKKDWTNDIAIVEQSKKESGTEAEVNLEEAIKALSQSINPEERLQRTSRPPIENLVFGSCGMNGVAFIGALKSLEDQGRLTEVKRVAGSSIGGLIGGLIGLGYTPSELENIFKEQLKSEDFTDSQFGVDHSQISSGDLMNLDLISLVSAMRHKGIYKGKKFQKIVAHLIERKLKQSIKQVLLSHMDPQTLAQLKKLEGFSQSKQANFSVDDYLDVKLNQLLNQMKITDLKDLTFGQLQQLQETFPELKLKDIYVTATNLDKQKLKVFSAKTEPDMKIQDAFRASLAYPGLFEPMEYEGDLYVDGTLGDAYPMEVFNKPEFLSHGLNEAGVNPCTLGLLVEDEAHIKSRWGLVEDQSRDLSLTNLVKQVIAGMHNRTEKTQDIYQANSLQIPSAEHQSIDFKLGAKKVESLVQAGASAMDDYQNLYMGKDVIYSSKKPYRNFMHKYYQKSPTELSRIWKEEIEPLLKKAQSLQPQISAVKSELSQELETLKTQSDQTNAQERMTEIESKLEQFNTFENALETLNLERDVLLKAMAFKDQNTQKEPQITKRQARKLFTPSRSEKSQRQPSSVVPTPKAIKNKLKRRKSSKKRTGH